MTEFHHGITAREAALGKIPIRNADTNTMAILAYADDADESVFPLDTPVLVTSINRVLKAAGATGNLRKNFEIISAITSPTLVVIRIKDPSKNGEFEQSLVIGTTDETGKRTGLQALLTVKSVLGIFPKIICVPDTETIDVANALGAICKKLRAYAYITPRDEAAEVLPTAEAVTIYREKMAFREIELIWPEWTSGNVFLGSGNQNGAISAGISPDLQYVDDWTERKIRWAIEVNDTLYPTEIGIDDEYSYLEDYLQENKEMLGITGEYKSESNEGENDSSVYIYNITNIRKFVRLIPDKSYKSEMKLIGNPTAKIDSDGVISFWLEANNEVIEPEPEPEICNCEQSWVLIPEITPTTTFNEDDQIFVAVKDLYQGNGLARYNNQPIIEIIEQFMTNVFPDHLELIRCDNNGLLLRNKTDDCLTLSVWGSIRSVSGDKEFVSYLEETDLCAYDASEVIPEPWPEFGSPFTFITSGGETSFYCAITEGTRNIAVDWGDGVLVKYPNYSGWIKKTGIAELSVVKVYVDKPIIELGVEGFVAVTDWGDTPVNGFRLRDILLPEYTGRRVPDYLPTYVTATSYMFGLTIFNDDISMWDVSRVTEMTSMFAECEYFNQPLDSWDVSKVTLFNAMFRSAKRFNQPLNSWNVGRATTLEHMFDDAQAFNQPLDAWNVSNVINMNGMFMNVSIFNQDISSWCVSKIPTAPDSFTQWNRPNFEPQNKPVWGTCPNG